jgi:hypothetical protein
MRLFQNVSVGEPVEPTNLQSLLALLLLGCFDIGSFAAALSNRNVLEQLLLRKKT